MSNQLYHETAEQKIIPQRLQNKKEDENIRQ